MSNVAAVTKTRRETRWNLLGCPKLVNRSQPLVGQSSPYCKDAWTVEQILLFKNFFPIVDICLSCEDIAGQSCAMVHWWRIFGDFLRPVFSASHVQHTSDLHSKFALRPHHVSKYGKWEASSCYAMLIGSRMWSRKCWHCRWPLKITSAAENPKIEHLSTTDRHCDNARVSQITILYRHNDVMQCSNDSSNVPTGRKVRFFVRHAFER